MGKIERQLTKALLWCIVQYRTWISISLLPCCRFYPSCSEYALNALQQKTLGQALALIAKRLLRCRPGGGSGLDWVPTASHSKKTNIEVLS